MRVSRPNILIIDDEVDKRSRDLQRRLKRKATAELLHPQEVTQDDLDRADLVLVDFNLSSRFWPERDQASSIALQPQDGLALAAVMRAHVGDSTNEPKAFAILTAYLSDLGPDLPLEQREHMIARLHDLEWVFPKRSSRYAVELEERVESLAAAVKQLPRSWARGRERAEELLGIEGSGDWGYRAWEDVEDCHPPIHELSTHSQGLVFIRWLLHRILPYPCFLLDTNYLAARLRVTHRSFVNALDASPKFRSMLAPFEYNGILSEFLGPRWWRAGAESFIWKTTKGQPQDGEKLRQILGKRTGLGFRAAEGPPVVCLNHELHALERTSTAEKAVRIQPDDWPSYADQAWTTIELARSTPSLAAVVVLQDRHLVGKS